MTVMMVGGVSSVELGDEQFCTRCTIITSVPNQETEFFDINDPVPGIDRCIGESERDDV